MQQKVYFIAFVIILKPIVNIISFFYLIQKNKKVRPVNSFIFKLLAFDYYNNLITLILIAFHSKSSYDDFSIPDNGKCLIY